MSECIVSLLLCVALAVRLTSKRFAINAVRAEYTQTYSRDSNGLLDCLFYSTKLYSALSHLTADTWIILNGIAIADCSQKAQATRNTRHNRSATRPTAIIFLGIAVDCFVSACFLPFFHHATIYELYEFSPSVNKGGTHCKTTWIRMQKSYSD